MTLESPDPACLFGPSSEAPQEAPLPSDHV